MGSDPKFSQGEAEDLAVEALGFIAGDETLLLRFLNLTGIRASDIRDAAREPGFAAGVLQFLCAHEPTLLAFCEASGIAPDRVVAAKQLLPGGRDA